MADPLHFLTNDDVRILRFLIDRARRQEGTAAGRFPRERTHAEGDDQMAPETYVAKTPSGGIPGLVSGDGGTGTAGFDEPGSAVCDVYLIDETDATPDLREIGRELTVYNTLASPVDGSIYVIIVRDKFGRWVITARLTLQLVKVAKDGGVAGDESTGCTWTYTLSSLANDELATTISPEQARYSFTKYFEAGAGGRSEYAIAQNVSDTWLLLWVPGEIEDVNACPGTGT